MTNTYHAMEFCFARMTLSNSGKQSAARRKICLQDGSMGFDFSGTYQEIKTHELISCELDDGRRVEISFKTQDGDTEIRQTFEAEDMNPIEMQERGWQAIMNNFKKYIES